MGFAVAALAGRAGMLAGLWWAFTSPTRSWSVESGNQFAGIIVFAVAASGVVLLAYRRDGGRDSKHRDRVDLHRQLSDHQDDSVASQVADEIEFSHALDAMLDDRRWPSYAKRRW